MGARGMGNGGGARPMQPMSGGNPWFNVQQMLQQENMRRARPTTVAPAAPAAPAAPLAPEADAAIGGAIDRLSALRSGGMPATPVRQRNPFQY